MSPSALNSIPSVHCRRNLSRRQAHSTEELRRQPTEAHATPGTRRRRRRLSGPATESWLQVVRGTHMCLDDTSTDASPLSPVIFPRCPPTGADTPAQAGQANREALRFFMKFQVPDSTGRTDCRRVCKLTLSTTRSSFLRTARSSSSAAAPGPQAGVCVAGRAAPTLTLTRTHTRRPTAISDSPPKRRPHWPAAAPTRPPPIRRAARQTHSRPPRPRTRCRICTSGACTCKWRGRSTARSAPTPPK